MSHKTVKAAQIVGVCPQVVGENTEIIIEGDTHHMHVVLEPSVVARYWPVIGDYLVVYADGYRSISPKKAFEEGYTEATA